MTIDLDNLTRLCAGWPGHFFSTEDGDLAYLPRTANGGMVEPWALAEIDGGPDQAVEMLNAVPDLVAEVERLRQVIGNVQADNEALRRRDAQSVEDWTGIRAEVERLRGLLCKRCKATCPHNCSTPAGEGDEGGLTDE